MQFEPKHLKMLVIALGVGIIIFASKYFGAV